nr:glycosyltransferase family 2 protein [bacterium]
FLDALEGTGADLVVGSRFIGSCTYRVPAARRLGMMIFGLTCSVFTGKRITDPTNGFRGMNRKTLRLYTRGFYPQHFPDADVIISSHYGGLRIVEVPVTVGPTRSVNLHRGWKILYYIYKMFLSTFVAILGRREKPAKEPGGAP